MALTLFRPNKGNTGAMVQFSLGLPNSKRNKGSLFVKITKQNGYDDGKHVGIFKDGKSTSVNFNIEELGQILAALKRNKQWLINEKSPVHRNDKVQTTIFFQPAFKRIKNGDKYEDTNEQLGFSLTFVRKEGDNSETFRIGLDYGALETIKRYIYFAFGEIFFHEENVTFEKSTATEPTENIPTSEPSSSPEDDIPF